MRDLVDEDDELFGRRKAFDDLDAPADGHAQRPAEFSDIGQYDSATRDRRTQIHCASSRLAGGRRRGSERLAIGLRDVLSRDLASQSGQRRRGRGGGALSWAEFEVPVATRFEQDYRLFKNVDPFRKPEASGTRYRRMLSVMRRVIWLLLAVAAVFGCGAAPRAQSAGTVSNDTRVSASVVVTTIGHNEADGTSTLDVAVFWRGTPGWFTAGDPGGQSGGGTSTGLSDGRRGPETHFIGVGGLRLEVQFDPGTGRVRIQDQSISSQSRNVILVDEVDGATGPRIVETMRVEPRFPGGSVDIDTLVRRHPTLFPFLRCEARRQRDPIRPAAPTASATRKKATHTTPEGLPVHSFDTLLAELASRGRNTYRLKSNDSSLTFTQVPDPTPIQRRASELLGVLPVARR